MSQSILSTLQAKGLMSADKTPMKPSEYDLTGGVPIVDIPRGTRCIGSFVIYDNATTSSDGRTLIQGIGRAYHGMVRDGELQFEVQRIDGELPFGVIERYPNDYFLANRQFVDQLKSKFD